MERYGGRMEWKEDEENVNFNWNNNSIWSLGLEGLLVTF